MLLHIQRLWSVWSPGSTQDESVWYTIDQWAINANRNHYYNDHVHYNGPLTHAMLHQVFHLLCPTLGLSREQQDLWQSHLIVVNRHHHAAAAAVTIGTAKGDLKEEPKEEWLEHFLYDTSHHLHVIPKICLPYLTLSSSPSIQLSEADISSMPTSTPFPAAICQEHALIRGQLAREVFVMQGMKYHLFPSVEIFASYGYEFNQVIVVEDWILLHLREGEPMEMKKKI